VTDPLTCADSADAAHALLTTEDLFLDQQAVDTDGRHAAVAAFVNADREVEVLGGAPQRIIGRIVQRFEGRGAQHIISHTMEMMLACMSMIWGGVCERHPKIRIAFLESGGGWIAPWLDRMDRHFDDQGFNDSGLKTRPSDLFRRNCWISFEPVEGSLKVLAEYIGPHKILWATDYPHRDGFFPGAPQMIKDRMAGASPDVQHQVMAGGAMGFYGLS
jgi:uncharacterized protein